MVYSVRAVRVSLVHMRRMIRPTNDRPATRTPHRESLVENAAIASAGEAWHGARRGSGELVDPRDGLRSIASTRPAARLWGRLARYTMAAALSWALLVPFIPVAASAAWPVHIRSLGNGATSALIFGPRAGFRIVRAPLGGGDRLPTTLSVDLDAGDVWFLSLGRYPLDVYAEAPRGRARESMHGGGRVIHAQRRAGHAGVRTW